MRWRTISITIILLLSSVYTITFNASATITISNVSPTNGQIHVDITDNPPDPGGYVTLSATLTDNTGNDDLEFWLDIWNGTAWVNRQHLVDQSSPVTIYQDETTFNHTNTTYQWRILALDHTDNSWNNQTFSFTTDRKPEVYPVYPENNSYMEKGNVELSAVVYHPDYEWGFTGLDFDGKNDEVVVSHSDDFNVSSFTVDTYINVTTAPSTNSYNAIIGHMSDSSTGYGVALYENHTGIMYLLANINDKKIYCNCTYLVVNEWYHVTVTYNANNHMLSFYINGNFAYSTEHNESPTPTIADLMIGGPPLTGLYKNFNGLMDYIRLYNRSLTPSEVKANYYGKNDNCVTDGLIGYWKLDENTGTTTSDSSGRNHDGTLENGVAWTTAGGGSATYYGKVYNVSFYEYPSGRLIGWNHTNTGWTNGQIVKCNQTFLAKYPATSYYWYARAFDDEYNTSSAVFKFTTNFTEVEPDGQYYSMGATIYTEAPYTRNEPTTLYYSMGAMINSYYAPSFNYPSPSDGATNVSLNPNLGIWMYKGGGVGYWNITFHTNDTLNETWHQIDGTFQTLLGYGANNQTIYDDQTTGTFVNTTNDGTDLVLDTNLTGAYYPTGYRESPEYTLSGRAKTTQITWSSTEPTNTSITVYYNLYTTSWSGWIQATNGGSISGITDGMIINNYKIKFKIVLNTTDDIVTPALHNLSLHIERYTYIEAPYSGLQYRQYWWYVNATRETTTLQSSIYTFTTELNETEPSIVYYSVGATIYTESIYSLLEPYMLYYSMGAQIRAIYKIEFSNPIPPNGSTGVTTVTPLLSVYVHSGTPKEVEVTFQQNDSGNWTDIPSTVTITTNATVTNHHYQLQYGTTHYWRVKAYNTSADATYYSDIYHFTTTEYNDTEPSVMYYSVGATVYLEGIYSLSEPAMLYYSMGAMVILGKPSVSDPYPADGSTFGMQFLTNFSVYVTDPANQSMNVSFYYANNNTCWSTITNVQSGARAVTTKLPALTNGTTLQWYVKVNDSHGWNITSPTWSYTPLNHAPTAVIRPQDGDNFIEVRRKTLGSWKPYVRLEANVTDIEHDRVTVQIYVDDPTLPNWNDWVLRFSHIYDGYSTYSASKYIHDELDFNQTKTQYHWWLHLEDEYGATTDYYVNFTTKFMFYAYFTYSPAHPTNEDTVYFTDLSVNATTIAWKIDDTIVAQSTFSSGNHNQFNLTKQFNISNVYNITMLIYNSSANVSEIYYVNLPVDRNITINKTGTGAGYNYIAYHLSNTTDAKHFAQNFSLERGWWVFKYDTQNQSWLGYFLYPDVNNGTGDNFNVLTWDALVVKANKNEKVRVNISYPVNTSQSLQLLKGYNYVAWSNETTTTSKNLSIGLQTGDWVYVYDTVSDTWYGYWVGYAGDDFVVNSYKILIIYPTGSRSVII